MNTPKIVMTIHVPVETRERLEQLARQADTSMTDVIIDAISLLYDVRFPKSNERQKQNEVEQ